MSRVYRRRDRTARLLKLQVLLWQYPGGLTIEEIARRCDIGKRTVYRDLEALESELGVPIWEQKSKRGLDKGHFLPPISFTLEEAMNIFLTARLMQNFSHLYNPSLASTFIKLNTIVPDPLKQQIQNTIECMESQPRDERKMNNYKKIVQAWLSQQRVKIWYQTFLEEKPVERIIEPYFIEPSLLRRTPIVICYCHLRKSIYAYNIDGIIGDANIEADTYEMPPDLNFANYLNSAWDAYVFDGEVETVKLHFSKQTCWGVMSTKWHPSQRVEVQTDGSLILTFRTRRSIDFRAWILGWGDDVEVLEPETLRNWVIELNKSVRRIYSTNGLPVRPMQSDRDRANRTPTEITDEQWELIKDIIPFGARTGRPRADDRRTINGIIWVLRTGCKWADMPRKYGAYSTCYARFQLWRRQGLWETIWQYLSPVHESV